MEMLTIDIHGRGKYRAPVVSRLVLLQMLVFPCPYGRRLMVAEGFSRVDRSVSNTARPYLR